MSKFQTSVDYNANLMTVPQLAKKLGIKERTVRDWVFKGKAGAFMVRVGRLVRFDPLKVQERINQGNILD